MARDSHKSAGAHGGAHGAEKTGGTLSGLFADENELDRRGLWRLGWWGAGAVGAVGLAIFVNQAAQGWRKDRISAADLSRQAQLLQSLARETQSEARQLGSAIETLNTDRDQLYRRVTILEQNVELVTGALAKQSAQASAASSSGSKPTPAPAPQIAAVESQPPAVPAPSSAQPSPLPAFPNLSPFMPVPGSAAAASPGQPGAIAAAPVAGVSADKPKPEPSKGLSVAITGTAAPVAGPSPSPLPAGGAAAAAGSRSVAPTDTAAKPEPDRLVKADVADPAAAKGSEAADAVMAIQKTEFAVDLGGANTIGGLRNLWRGLAKTNPDLAALKPIMMVKEARGGAGMQLRLGAGPLTDAAAAARICAALAETQRPCETTVYDGQRLAVGEEPEGAEAKPVTPATAAQKPGPGQRRRFLPPQAQRHGKREEPPPSAAAAPAAPPAEAPKPEQPSALSSFFRRS
ncbi:conserved hypothetical protein [Bradyrhizobium sp. ORS 278]|uniref:hypothetical protein n=1 Tax=Bradyrhizobium sp. (strain ORS 278) TaxID=114615 RepID=UPI0001508446|nr:hypothetical protein [Bradyrhizobium sp. ORS 278]CAL77529.1 conserved hypothetical protein [Bradyrhizobium sp. ORS 278]